MVMPFGQSAVSAESPLYRDGIWWAGLPFGLFVAICYHWACPHRQLISPTQFRPNLGPIRLPNWRRC